MPKAAIFGRRLLLGHGAIGTFLVSSAALARVQGQTVPRTDPHADKAKLPLVMLDPGHGGKDPGAIGYSGTYEKHVAFAAAEEVRRQLLQDGNCRVAMTRRRDVFIPLETRVAIAQAHGAVVFVSMHADALSDPDVRGASVYTLSDTASDAQTAALARRENSADRFAEPGFRDAPPAVAQILASLVRRETRRDSTQLSRDIVRSLGDGVALLPNPGRHAGFVVLQSADIPSVLIEMGFMSNPTDEAALRTTAHRTVVAGAIRRAVQQYLAAASRQSAAAD